MTAGFVAVGASLGGLSALDAVFSALSPGFPWPVAVVQHRSAADVGDGFAVMLARRCPLPVREVEDKDPIEPGRVYLAPADYHLLVTREGFALSTEARVSFARPSVDVLFDAAAAAFGPAVLAVVLTGASGDGALGAARVKAAGGTLFVQDPADAECAVMPRAALAAAKADRVLALDQIGPALNLFAAMARHGG